MYKAMTNNTPSNDPCKTEARRNQVLCAAAQCFRQSGFHGASMANIARTAQMSVGHIYHYFANKEAIIGAFVTFEHDKNRLVLQSLIDADNTIQAMLDHAACGLDENLDAKNISLHLEILTEATRNPNIAAILQESDRELCELSYQLMLKARGSLKPLPAAMMNARAEAIVALFQGFGLRSLVSQRLERDEVLAVLRQTIQHIVEH